MRFVSNIKSYVWSKNFLKHLGLIVLVYIIVIGGTVTYLNSYTNHGQKIEVPNLVGKNVSSIKPIIENSNLNFEVVEKVYDPTKPEGTILDQDPKATDISLVHVKEGRIIKVRVSKKSALVEMPSLVATSVRYAESVLKNRGLESRIEYVPSIEDHGAVLKQLYRNQPIQKGVKIPIGSRITLVVGRNEYSAPVLVPNLFGLTISEVKTRLAETPSLQLNIVCDGCVTVEDSLNAKVMEQTPEFIEGSMIQGGSTISIFASPNFVNK
jgi:eukaryotic-like serine/threonine-protein kinase